MPLPGLVVLVDAEDHAGALREDRVEERLALRDRIAVEARAPQRLGVGARAVVREPPDHRGRRGAVGQRLAERLVEHHRRERRELRIRAERREEGAREGRATLRRRVAQRREIGLVERAHRLQQARVDLGLGQRARQRLEQRRAQVEHVLRELEVEEGRLPLLELRRRGQHVVREPRRLGQRDVDHDDELERLERLSHALAVGERVRRIGALDEQRAEALRVVGEDLARGSRCTGSIPPMMR